VLIYRMVEDAPERAQSELTALLDTARQVLADVRSVSSSYRILSLEDETATARALLTAADIAVTVHHEAGELPEDVRTTLASVLREGVTNLLQHSEAGHCHIRIRNSGRLVSITIINDGVRLPARSFHGNGIGNLANRVDGLGGRLIAGTMAGGYRIHAEIPLRRAS
jgi:signal transduction histidine kinase